MSMLDWRYYPKIARIARMAGADVGRGSETLMTYSRGDLFRAARHLSGSKEGRPARALVVTGFYIPKAAQPAAETDGPLGALEVCMALRAIGGDAWLVSDECCAPVIRPSALGFLPDDHVLIAPNANPKGGFDARSTASSTLPKPNISIRSSTSNASARRATAARTTCAASTSPNGPRR